MKYTEGAFREWAYGAAKAYGDHVGFDGEENKIVFNDRIADNMFMQVILMPEEYDLLLCPNLNGDYLSDACAALVGGLGVAPGVNIGKGLALFEPVHGSAPDLAGKNMANPTAMLLSAVLMLRHIEENTAADRLEAAIAAVLKEGRDVTADLGGRASTSGYADAVIAKML